MKSKFESVSNWIKLSEEPNYLRIELLLPEWFIDKARTSRFAEIVIRPKNSYYYFSSCCSKAYFFANSEEAFYFASQPLREEWLKRLEKEIRHCDYMHIKNICR